ncbi:MAG TPA: adenylate/guanylate cyclase domain-containing protein [bacterium]|nr:adenylate/guanylate cyclase domain-containing protein [bacterium]
MPTLKTSSWVRWGTLTLAFVGAVSWYLSGDLVAAGASAAAALVILFFSWRALWFQVHVLSLRELEIFLVRSRILPPDHKFASAKSLSQIQKTRRELMDMGYEEFKTHQKKLQEARHVLDKFVGTKASQFATQTGNKAVWEGQLTKVIVLFSDVRGFTSMTEKLKPQETVRYLNRMFSELEELVSMAGGEVNKYIGDAVLAFFPFPEENPAPATKRVLQAALRMQDSFHEIQGKFRETYSEVVNTGLGVGIAAGDVILGNLGSSRRMEFTLIGDTVNLASRLCSIAEDGQVLINTELAHVAAEQFRMEALDPVRIKGKSGTYTPYWVQGERIQQGLA